MARTKASWLASQGLYEEPLNTTSRSKPTKGGNKSPNNTAQKKAQAALEKLRARAEKAKTKEADKIAREMEKSEKKIEAALKIQEKKVEAQLATALRKEAERAEKKALKAKERVEREAGAKALHAKKATAGGKKEKSPVPKRKNGVKQTDEAKSKQRQTELQAVVPVIVGRQVAKRTGGTPGRIQTAKRTGGAPGGNEKKRPKLGAGDSPFVGEWEIEIPDNKYGDDYDEYYLSVHRNHSGVLEAAFGIAPIEGTIKFDKNKLKATDRTATFAWRGRETGENEIQLDSGSNHKGSISIKSINKLTGFYVGGYGRVEFEGTKVSDTPEHQVTPWECFSYEAHEYERVKRWR